MISCSIGCSIVIITFKTLRKSLPLFQSWTFSFKSSTHHSVKNMSYAVIWKVVVKWLTTNYEATITVPTGRCDKKLVFHNIHTRCANVNWVWCLTHGCIYLEPAVFLQPNRLLSMVNLKHTSTSKYFEKNPKKLNHLLSIRSLHTPTAPHACITHMNVNAPMSFHDSFYPLCFFYPSPPLPQPCTPPSHQQTLKLYVSSCFKQWHQTVACKWLSSDLFDNVKLSLSIA